MVNRSTIRFNMLIKKWICWDCLSWYAFFVECGTMQALFSWYIDCFYMVYISHVVVIFIINFI